MSRAAVNDDRPQTISAARFNFLQRSTLMVSRCYFLSFAEPHSQAWEFGLQRAEALFGPSLGGMFGSKVLAYVQGMRGARRNAFSFANPFCECCRDRLTEHERLFISALGCVQREELSQARLHSLILCEGHSTDAMLDAADRLCDWHAEVDD